MDASPALETQDQEVRRLARDFLIFYIATLLFFTVGIITTMGLGWYESLEVPAWALPREIVAAIWGTLFITTVVSVILFCDQAAASRASRKTLLMYMGNVLLVLLWNYLFFSLHLLIASLWVAIAVGISVLVLALRVRTVSHISAWLLVPYFAWVLYAVSLNYGIMLMN